MTLQNRVLPTGDIVALDFRGDLMGNRGVLHDDNRTLGASRWKMHAWVTCVLDFKGRARTVMTPNRYTELFFLDEASAFAAGHRPCGECRRDSYLIFRGLWEDTFGAVSNVKDIDHRMHQDRVRRDRSQVRFTADPGTLPDEFAVQAFEPLSEPLGVQERERRALNPGLLRVTIDFQSAQRLRSHSIGPGIAADCCDPQDFHIRGIQQHIVHKTESIVVNNDAPRFCGIRIVREARKTNQDNWKNTC